MEMCVFLVCVFKQKTAYEMRISDWSSDVCCSDLARGPGRGDRGLGAVGRGRARGVRPAVAAELGNGRGRRRARHGRLAGGGPVRQDRKSVVSGKSVSVRVDLGCRRILTTEILHLHSTTHTLTRQTANTQIL